jgi:hypothetical protein
LFAAGEFNDLAIKPVQINSNELLVGLSLDTMLEERWSMERNFFV